mgnify:CR=1 FL=1
MPQNPFKQPEEQHVPEIEEVTGELPSTTELVQPETNEGPNDTRYGEVLQANVGKKKRYVGIKKRQWRHRTSGRMKESHFANARS